MIKSVLLGGFVLFSVSVFNAQTNKTTQIKKFVPATNTKLAKDEANTHQHLNFPHCGTDEAMELLFKQDPSTRARYEAAQREAGAWENPAETERLIGGGNSVMSPAPQALDTIPIVFHILHQNGSENVSNQVIYDALAQINLDYQKLDPDTTTISAFFQPRATSCNLVFALATKDPNGACTNGIIRHYDANTNWDQSAPGYSYTGTTAGKWDPRKYLNVYIVKNIISAGGGGGIVVGYTYRPGTWSAGNAADCIVYNASFLGAANKDIRSLAHEIGHWLNLAHTFGSTNQPGVSCGDDVLGSIAMYGGAIDDTPKTLGFFSTCPAETPNSCDASNYANVQNIMDYSSCPKMFTLGQCRRMRYTLTLTTSGRNNLVTAANKIATGIRNPQVCVPIANFGANVNNACVGANVTFADSTLNAVVTGWNWDFPGATPSTSTAASPVVTYSAPGTYAVTYTATNSAGSNTISKNAYITVGNNVATVQSSLIESFESIAVPNADWVVDNTSGGNGWAQNNTVGFTGTNSVKINNINNTLGATEVLYTPSYSIAGINALSPGTTFTFKVAYQRGSTTAAEKLQVYSSTNCGQTWNLRYSKSGSGLATTTAVSTTPFVPTPTQWRTETVSISALMSQSNVWFKFVFTADPTSTTAMNNIYIDDINISNNGVGLNELFESSLSYNVYPNPNDGNMNVSFTLSEKKNVKIELIDLLGKTLETATNSILQPGDYNFELGKSNKLAQGIYFAKMTVDGKVYTQKVIVE